MAPPDYIHENERLVLQFVTSSSGIIRGMSVLREGSFGKATFLGEGFVKISGKTSGKYDQGICPLGFPGPG